MKSQDHSLVTGHPAPQKTAVIGFIMNDVFVAFGQVFDVRVFGIKQTAVRINPKHIIRRQVGKGLDGLSPSGKANGQEWKLLCGLCPADASQSDHVVLLCACFEPSADQWQQGLQQPTQDQVNQHRHHTHHGHTITERHPQITIVQKL